jgi:hypothetical protein
MLPSAGRPHGSGADLGTARDDRIVMKLAHIAVSLQSVDAVEAAAARFAAVGLLVAEPRRSGNGFYEAVVQTPEGMLI